MYIINSKEIINNIKEELKLELSTTDKKPCLAIIQVEGDLASNSYVKNKKKLGDELGVRVDHYLLPAEVEEVSIIKLIKELNVDDNTHGIIVQLPLPKHLSERHILDTINPNKDVDGLGTHQIGQLSTNIDKAFIPCTALGVVKMLEAIVNIESKDIVIVNRSHLIGLPLQTILTSKNATVTICHSKTKNLREKIQKADIVITGIGKANYFTKYYFRNDQIIIDCSMNRDSAGRLVGDVFKETLQDLEVQIASGPGHTGPFTVLSLFMNTIKAFKNN